uniref:DUF3310 domain-containing protein n=1 Tax=uncultured Thiotrichaceae bacterium TaxID=298394 RepID=A0A6S6UM22_9GAMM|nr:MAG: Unknown protein [uncultured Thiotrichaceae bacterium]
MPKVKKHTPVKQPSHYSSHPSGVQCVTITQHMNFCRGNAIKYTWRAGEKNPDEEIQDLQKAKQYLKIEIKRLKKLKLKGTHSLAKDLITAHEQGGK